MEKRRVVGGNHQGRRRKWEPSQPAIVSQFSLSVIFVTFWLPLRNAHPRCHIYAHKHSWSVFLHPEHQTADRRLADSSFPSWAVSAAACFPQQINRRSWWGTHSAALPGPFLVCKHLNFSPTPESWRGGLKHTRWNTQSLIWWKWNNLSKMMWNLIRINKIRNVSCWGAGEERDKQFETKWTESSGSLWPALLLQTAVISGH